MSGTMLTNPFFLKVPYVANGVDFDGTNDYLTRGADLTGSADSKLFSGSFWFKRNVTGGNQEVYGWESGVQFARFMGGNQFGIKAADLNSTTILDAKSSAITDTASWHHLMFSFDMADTGKRHLYVDDSSDLASVPTYSNVAINFTITEHAIGASFLGSNKINTCLGDLWIAPGQYIDLSVLSNRRKFIDASSKPVDLGSDGSLPTGTAPLMFFQGATSTWHTNKGTGGGFTENGALTDCATSP